MTRISLSLLALLSLLSPVTAQPPTSKTNVSTEGLFQAFTEKICREPKLPIDAKEFEHDMHMIQSPLGQLLTFTALQPENNRDYLEKILIKCLKVLARKEGDEVVAHSRKALNAHAKMIAWCNKRFLPFCHTPEEALAISTHFNSIHAYYSPFATVFPTAQDALPNDRYSKKTIALCSIVGAAAVIAVAALIIKK